MKRTLTNKALKPIGSLLNYNAKYSNSNSKIRNAIEKDQQCTSKSTLKK